MDYEKNRLDSIKKIEFSFTHYKHKFILSLDYLFQDKSKSLKTKIKDECEKYNIILYEENIILYDFKNNIKIEKYSDLIDYSVKNCTIIIVPITLEN